MRKGLLFLNGEAPNTEVMDTIDFSLPVVCADGAYRYLKPYCKAPTVLLGDFDSLDICDETVPADTKVVRFGAEKDFTDGFLAVKLMIEQGFTHIDIYGALGGRPDHEMSNYLLLMLAREKGVHARIIGNSFFVYLSGETFTAHTKIGKTVSLVPFTDNVHILFTKGLKYPIQNLVMSKIDNLAEDSYIMGVSNCAVSEEIVYAIDRGLALVYLEK